MTDFTVSLVQTDLHWHEPAANRAALTDQLAAALAGPGLTDLIVLPEMFTTGFSMAAAAQAEPAESATLAWLREQAARYDAVVTGSVMVAEGGRYYNRLLWVRPDGSYSAYDKRHLFRMAGEHEVYTAGAGRLVEEWRGWRIQPLVCYDLRFPVWSRNPSAEPYDLLLYVANWPHARVHAWKVLLQARAIENLTYVAGVNRIGLDGLGVEYSGHTMLLDPRGDYLAQAGSMPTILTRRLMRHPLHEAREQLSALSDADAYELK
ncbi:amidohydrolase [Hymenobacter sp. BT559]|uniref:amidohydrolase n=1 Tax=Hymenobacter sp. BT559 TaxID=2795729 RepID=UPI0018EBC8E6|nr:amidohydrolase [Hymenobacter sp. BT559]MBJ6143077.1 amidohydrolase [Hymenobacter sp. BT559]